jgi:DNA-binding beta-propeller fold protein YncE
MRSASLITLLLCFSSSQAIAQAPTWVGSWSSPSMCSPRGIALVSGGDVFVGSDCSTPHIERFTSTGSFVTLWNLPVGPQQLNWPPNGVAVDASGNVLITDYEGGAIQKFSSAGTFITSWAASSGPADVAVDAGGSIYVTLLRSGLVRKYTGTGTLLATFGSPGSGAGQFQGPSGIALDGLGHVFVADETRQRILRFTTAGVFELEFDPGAPPTDLAAGPDGNLYITTFQENRIRKFSPSGASLLSFQSPNGLSGTYRIVINSTGGIFVTEQLNNRVTKFQMPAITSAARATFSRLHALYR